ncbi:DUF2971 domain-containing protein [Labilibacter marinus]|uniref:DUF2971 domain-containing protein n=1 Tax=Labilibacter marinus TaxID=1477105 RepID=UPI0008303FA3|nr:DUF2971 domain-containing protein [Labilibacter marinus]
MNDGYNTYLAKSYRFFSFEVLFNTIKNRSLRFKRVDKFNDPLDNSPYLASNEWKHDKEQGDGSLGNFLKKVRYDKISKELESLYICCFCKEYKSDDSYLMWSHYGLSHSQVCIEIDFSKYTGLSTPSEVIYPKNLVEKRNNILKHKKESIGLFVVTNKLRQWSYEKEVRLIVDIRTPNIDLEKFKLCDNSYSLDADFDLESISKVIFGIKSELSNEIETRKLFLTNGLTPKYEKMYIDPNTLKLESKPYTFDKAAPPTNWNKQCGAF